VFPKALGGAGDVVIDGAFAEYTAVPISSMGPMPDDMGWDRGAMVEPVACCLHGIDRSRIKQGDIVAVIGAGPIGLTLVQLAALHGAGSVLSIEKDPIRGEEAKKIGATETLNPEEERFDAAFQTVTQGRKADVVIEAVGSAETSELALRLVKKGGWVNLFGVAPEDAVFPCHPFHIYYDEIQLIGTYALTPDAFRRSLSLLGSGRVDVKHLITHRLSLEDGQQGFDLTVNRVGLKKILFPHSASG